MTVHVPMPGQGPVPVPEIFIDNQRVEHVQQFKYLGQIIASDGKVKREVSRRLALGYAAFNKLGKQGIWKDKLISRRTKLTLYQVIVRTVLLYCAETWPVGPADVNKLDTAQMSCLRRICGDRSWGADCTPYAELRRQCQMPSIENLITYHRLRWLGKVCRMSHDRLPVRTLFGRISGHGPRGRPHKTWIEFTRDDLTRLSELQGVRGTYINWWVRCKDWKVWTMNIHKFKQTDNTCRTGSAQAGVH